MATDLGHVHLQKAPASSRTYSPDILPHLQTLLADLADIDFAYEKNLEAIKRSPVEEERKREMIARLWQQHRERRAPYVQELMLLREQIEATFA